MSQRKSFAIVLMSVATSLFGCADTRGTVRSDGAIQFEVRPEYGASPSSGARGSFAVHGVNNAYQVRVPLAGDAFQRPRVSVPAGAYWLAWEPESLDSSVDQLQTEAAPNGPYMVVVAPAQVTTIDVDIQAPADRSASVAMLAAEGPHGDGRVPR